MKLRDFFDDKLYFYNKFNNVKEPIHILVFICLAEVFGYFRKHNNYNINN